MEKRHGRIIMISGNLISVEFGDKVLQNEVGYVLSGQERLKSEVVKITGNVAHLQVYEDTKGLKVGQDVEFSRELLSVQLGPGLLGRVYNGLQDPLVDLAEKFGFFLPRGVDLQPLDYEKKWHFTPVVKPGDSVFKGQPVGFVKESIFKHLIMVPFNFKGEYTIEEVAKEADYTIKDKIAVLKDKDGNHEEISMVFDWPVKVPITAYRQKFSPKEPLITRIRIIDTFFPVAKGGTYCIPGPFGAGKTVLQQLTSRYAEADVVIIAQCGERASETVETLKEFPELNDPRTGKSLMERTIIICNTSAMPVAAREASVYTAAALGEYYRQMGLNVLMLADSTSRWAQAMRELSGRLEEIPGEEAYPAYLESKIAEFYERAGLIETESGQRGSLTIGGTVSPAGGNFEEPVTQSTLKVVGAFHGLSRERAEARQYPSLDPLESWTKYTGFIDQKMLNEAREVLVQGNEVNQMMKVVGEEGTSIEDYVVYLKAGFLDNVYLQQNGFDPVDASTSRERQEYVFKKVFDVLQVSYKFESKGRARDFFHKLRSFFIDWNYKEWKSEEFKKQEKKIDSFIEEEGKNEKSSQQDT